MLYILCVCVRPSFNGSGRGGRQLNNECKSRQNQGASWSTDRHGCVSWYSAWVTSSASCGQSSSVSTCEPTENSITDAVHGSAGTTVLFFVSNLETGGHEGTGREGAPRRRLELGAHLLIHVKIKAVSFDLFSIFCQI